MTARKYFPYALGVLILVGTIDKVFGLIPEGGSEPAAYAPSIPRAAPTGLTLAKYHQLREGISYAAAVRILASEGTELSRNYMDGVPGVMPTTTTVMYMWEGRGGANMNAIFQNDKLVQKAQFGLK